jgi:hypothetical protein
MEKNPDGYGQTFAQNCKVKIERTEGQLYLNYEKRAERIVGHFTNLRQEGELILADISLLPHAASVESRLEYAIEGGIVSKNESNEVDSLNVKGVSAVMHFKS